MDKRDQHVGASKGTDTTDIVLAVFYSIVILTGIFGNSLVVVVVWKTRSMHTATNYLLVNLAVSDILVLLWCPNTYNFAVVASLPEGIVGDYLCRFFVGDAMYTLGLGVTLFTLTTLAFERYQALVRPMNMRYTLSKERVIYAIAATWVLSLAVDIPDFVFTHYEPESGNCISPWSINMADSRAIYVYTVLSILIFLPSVVITFCYIQILRGMFINRTIFSGVSTENPEKKKLAVIIIAVTVAFYISFLPYFAFMLYITFAGHFKTGHVKTDAKLTVFKILKFFTVASCSLNPVLYALRSDHYKKGFKGLFCENNAVMEEGRREEIEL